MTKKCVICKKKYRHGVALFEFPVKGDSSVLEKWKSAGAIDSSCTPYRSQCICSEHFKPEEMARRPDGERLHLIDRSIFPTINVFTKPSKYLIAGSFVWYDFAGFRNWFDFRIRVTSNSYNWIILMSRCHHSKRPTQDRSSENERKPWWNYQRK